MQTRAQFTFLRWNASFLASYGVVHAILVFIAWLALGINTGGRIWLLLFLPLLACGFVGSVLIYWSRQSYDRPKSGAIRLGLGILVFLNLYMGILLFSAVKLGVLSSGDALNGYGPYVLPSSILGSIAVYVVARRMLEASRSE
jgi:hypothetical protein